MDLDKLQQIEKLNELKEKKILSQKEFDKAKQDILTEALQQNVSVAPSIIIQNSASATASAGGDNKRYSVLLAFFLCLFGGWLGLHRFYTGYPFSGFIYLISFGLFGLGWFWDLISIFFGFYRDPDGKTLG